MYCMVVPLKNWNCRKFFKQCIIVISDAYIIVHFLLPTIVFSLNKTLIHRYLILPEDL